jgi:hypothetical protein
MRLGSQVETDSPSVKKLCNGNGSETIRGRGLAHRKWTLAERIGYAADVATRVRRFDPSLGQISSLFHVNVAALRAEIKARNGNGHEDALEATRACLRAIVDELGLGVTVDLLGEIEADRLD